MTKFLAFLGALLMLGDCAANSAADVPACPAAAPPGSIYLISHGWHTDLALPTTELTGGLAVFRRIFPGARTLVIGSADAPS